MPPGGLIRLLGALGRDAIVAKGFTILHESGSLPFLLYPCINWSRVKS